MDQLGRIISIVDEHIIINHDNSCKFRSKVKKANRLKDVTLKWMKIIEEDT